MIFIFFHFFELFQSSWSFHVILNILTCFCHFYIILNFLHDFELSMWFWTFSVILNIFTWFVTFTWFWTFNDFELFSRLRYFEHSDMILTFLHDFVVIVVKLHTAESMLVPLFYLQRATPQTPRERLLQCKQVKLHTLNCSLLYLVSKR